MYGLFKSRLGSLKEHLEAINHVSNSSTFMILSCSHGNALMWRPLGLSLYCSQTILFRGRSCLLTEDAAENKVA